MRLGIPKFIADGIVFGFIYTNVKSKENSKQFMKSIEKLDSEIKNLEKHLSRLRKDFEQLRVSNQEAIDDLKTGDVVAYCKKPDEKGRVYKITKYRVAVLFESGKLRYYKRKNLTKIQE